MKRIVSTLALSIACAAVGVEAKECKGVNFPDQIQVDGAALTLNGLG